MNQKNWGLREVPLRVENCYKLKSPLEINIDEELKMKHACSKLVLGNVYVHRCKLAGKYFENEKWWCGIHRPSRVEKHKEKIKKIVRIELDKLDQLDKKDKATEALIRAVEEAHDWFDAAGYHDEVLLNDIFKAYLKLLNLRRKAISTTGAEGKDDV